MNWVRMHSLLSMWPGGGPAPSFDISADENGSAVVELAWDPQAMMAPARYPNPLRYYSSHAAFSATITRDNGSSMTINVPAQTIQLQNNRASWTIPDDLWAGYVEESLKSLSTPPTTTFTRSLYFRVRVTPVGAGSAVFWPDNATLSGPNRKLSPRIGISPISATPSSQIVPDMAAVQAMGTSLITGRPLGDLLLWFWQHLPATDEYRRALEATFTHPAFTGADLGVRASILKLWLFGGKEAAKKIPQLLSRNAVVGSNLTQPVITKTALRGGKTLADTLLDLLWITPHPDLQGVTTNEQLLDDVITEILDPNGQVNQGPAGTCAPTSMQTLLITVNPAEYARLQVGLLSSSASATLANGATISVPPTIFQAALYIPHGGNQPLFVRTNAELGFQAAILKYGQGNRFPALNGTPQSNAIAFKRVIDGGLFAAESKRVLDGLFNVNFTSREIPWPPQPAQPSYVASQTAVRDGFLADLPGRQQQMLLTVFWGAPYGQPSPPNGSHAVLALRRDGGRVFYKNPQYAGSGAPSGLTPGSPIANPPRRAEDPTQSMESIADADLATWILGYFVPDSVII